MKRHLCYASGTLLGWFLAKGSGAKETLPFTLVGGLVGFALGEHVAPPPTVKPKVR